MSLAAKKADYSFEELCNLHLIVFLFCESQQEIKSSLRDYLN